MVISSQNLKEKALNLPGDSGQTRLQATAENEMTLFIRQMKWIAGDQITPSDTRYGHLAINMLIVHR